MKKILTTLALTGVVGAGLVGGRYVISKKTSILDRHEQIELKDSTIQMPEYNLIKLGAGNCSGYVRRAAEEIFDKKYSIANAWDRRYLDKSVTEVDDNQALRVLYDNGKLKKGMIVGVYYPKSSHNEDIDIKGERVDYTHNLLFLGESPKGELTFAEQFGKKVRTRKLEEFAKDGLEAREILDSKK